MASSERNRKRTRKKGPHRGALPKSHPKRVAAHLRAQQAVELRVNGATYEQIATTLGYASRGHAYDAIDKLLDAEKIESSRKIRRVETRRLERLWFAMYPLAQRGDAKAAGVCVRILQRRAHMNGLDKPQKLKLSGDVNVKEPGFKVYAGFDPAAVVGTSRNGVSTLPSAGGSADAHDGSPPASRD